MTDSHLPTTKVSCLILEDDPAALAVIQDILSTGYPELTLYRCTTLAEADKVYALYQPTLLILDVNLPDGNSLEWLKQISGNTMPSFRVIFITAFADYAVDAFKFSALDFLLKPYLPVQLLTAVGKGLSSLNQQQYQRQLETFFYNYAHQAREDKKIVLKTLEDIFVVSVQDICTAEADSSYTHFVLNNGQRILVSQSLKEFDQQLSPYGFMRVHQSHLVNLKYVKAYKKKSNLLILTGDLEIPVSQNKKTQLMTYFSSL